MRLILSYPLFFLALICLGPFGLVGQDIVTAEQVQKRLMKNFIDAEKDRQLGLYDEALSKINVCLTIDNKNAAFHYVEGKVFEDLNRVEEAEESFKTAHEIDGTNDWYLISWLEILAKQERYKESIKGYELLVKRNPNNPEHLLGHANTLMYAGKIKKGLEAFRNFEQVAGLRPDVSIMKYRFFIGEGKPDKAAEEIERLIDAYPTDSRHFGFLADHYKAMGHTAKALEVYKRAAKVDPSNPYIQLSLAEFHDRNQQMDSSYTYLKKAYANPSLDIDTKIGVLLNLYAKAETDLDTRAKAIELCGVLESVHPEDAKSYSVYGDFLVLDKRNVKAREKYLSAIQIDPSRFPIWSQIMFIDSELGENDSLAKHSTKVIELFPAQPAAYLFNGIANNSLGDHQKAVKSLRAGSQMVFGNPPLAAQMLASLGDAYHELGRDQSSDSAYSASLVFDPENIYVLNNYSYFLALRGEKLESAKEMSYKTVQMQPTNASYLDTYGWILYRMEDYAGALDYLQEAFDNGGRSSSEVCDHLGDAMFKNELPEKALEHWNKALEIDPESTSIKLKIESGGLGD